MEGEREKEGGCARVRVWEGALGEVAICAYPGGRGKRVCRTREASWATPLHL